MPQPIRLLLSLMQKNNVRLPPGPSWLHLAEIFGKDLSYRNIEYPLELTEKYGDIIYSRPLKIYILTGPKQFEHVLKINPKNYIRHPNVYRRMRFAFGNSLLVNEGNAWKYRRKMALPAYQHQQLHNYIPTIVELAQTHIEKWQKERPHTINLLSEMNQLSLNIALNLFCRRSLPQKTLKFLGEAIGFCNYYCSLSPSIHPLKPSVHSMRFFYFIYKIDQILLEIIETRRKNYHSHSDLLGYLLDSTSEETGKPMSNKEILAEFKTHIITGHETTACALSWMWYLLSQNPDYFEPLESELETVLNNRTPTENDLSNLPFTKAIISESLRLYPPIWSLARTNIESDIIDGYEIPKNASLILHLYALHQNPAYWEYPKTFYPERFLNLDNKRHPFTFLPFSAGSHTCIASHFAMLEITLLTAVIAKRFRFECLEKSPVIPEPCISLRPTGGIKMRPIHIS